MSDASTAVTPIVVPRLTSRDQVVTLAAPGGIGVELGVAEAGLSEKLIGHQVLSHLFCIDMYAGDRGHDVDQYKRAIARLLPFKERSTLLKLRFDEALDLFPDECFDFIYVDGYAHTGEEGGRTIVDWYPKLKPGGIVAGDDYHPRWPLVLDAVHAFVTDRGLPLYLIDCAEDVPYARYPTWFTAKPSDGPPRDFLAGP